ncbi:pre-mRNA 3' end processing protein WDR33-like [Mytilus californianus]|uniref:pre-mRNA 3' end processing protein WDR33-like n=1 Tax=Mytilus californianus TaxID=6549 RepID=UPI002247704E|nr:pre-mRNA 3' end processing protein WDR33-like [Mytilus californianus]
MYKKRKVSGRDYFSYLDNTNPIVTAVSTIPGVNEGSTEDFNNMEDKSEEDISIPGLDCKTDAQFLKDSHREQNQRRKIPYSRPIDRDFVHAWRSNKQPPAISGEKVDEKPKAPLPSLLELPSVKPAEDFNLETLKDEEGDRHRKQLRQGRNKG